ncbi:cytochrome c oxidase subunit 3 [Methylocystis parvus]|uniref:Cytochrome c oxidase subunit 3 n=1 Tax=Methylocystis parvus TaxID=134 RepID=A0A6B8M3W0_9HYPH|nr:cytochrome c oxidase subunit 3 [Methylocystis parvus]QGM96782.1 cytochrome c oxidase subunit 3 [Methylocystis parvus]WBJ99342.1 cytochrome c oxidase subunit 3 [Methylocystis parvus OBBP]
MSEAIDAHGFQFADAAHQRETAVAGMWAFLATECLFFGPLFLAWVFSRQFNQPGFDFGASQTNLTVGAINTALLITSSFAYGVAHWSMGKGRRRLMFFAFGAAWLLGLAFIALKFGVEWPEDFHRGLFPGAAFSVPEPRRGGAALFFSFYFLSTAVHGAHLLIGLALLAWIIWRVSASPDAARTPVVVVGLYWSFVDMVWLILFPLIYLIGRGA